MPHRLYPVILCGGVGSRLWPVSTPSLPKQFARLVGDISTFQDAVARVSELEGVEQVLVVASVRHDALIVGQLATIGVDAQLILEPEGRESGPAMAAAAAWVHRRDPEGVAIFAAADHLLPDRAAYARAMHRAADAAAAGRIVTLGVRPHEPSVAYGYIRAPGEGTVRPIERFVEKPAPEVAKRYLADGYLWNAGSFVASADVLLGEMRRLCPDVLEATETALDEAGGAWPAVRLGPSFQRAPKIAFDHAVMEKTDRASVVEVEFAWSDLGAWDAVWAASEKDMDGNVVPPGSEALDAGNLLVRAGEDQIVAVVGVSNVAVIVENRRVLVCSLAEAQKVKAIAARAADQ